MTSVLVLLAATVAGAAPGRAVEAVLAAPSTRASAAPNRASAKARPPPEKTPVATPKNPVFVECDQARMEGSRQRFFCTGHVKMLRDGTTLTCERAIGHYVGKDAQQVRRLECDGNVQAVDGERRATGEHADYDTEAEVLVATGNPEAFQGGSRLKGDRVVFHVGTDLIEVSRVRGTVLARGKETRREPPRGKPAEPPKPMDVACDRGRMEGAQQRFLCTGHVKLLRNTTTVTCDRAVGHYVGKEVQELTRLECFGNVEAVDGERWARGEQADYDTTKELLVVTGHPEARQGSNRMQGDRVVFSVDSDRIDVERVTGVLEARGRTPRPGATPGATTAPSTPATPAGPGRAP